MTKFGSIAATADIESAIAAASQTAPGTMSAADKKKLDGIAEGANAYTLPQASASALGGVKVGAGLMIGSDGTLNATGGGTADAVAWDNVTGRPFTALGATVKAEAGKLEVANALTPQEPVADLAAGATLSDVIAAFNNLNALVKAAGVAKAA